MIFFKTNFSSLTFSVIFLCSLWFFLINKIYFTDDISPPPLLKIFLCVTTWRSFFLCCFGRVRKTALRELHTHHKKKKVYPVYEGKKVFLTLRGGSSSLIFTTIGYKKTHTHTAYIVYWRILLMEVMSPQPPPGGTKNI